MRFQTVGAITLVLLLLTIHTGFSARQHAQNWFVKKASAAGYERGGPRKTETRTVGAFTELEVSSAIQVIFTQGSAQPLTLEADEDMINNIRTEVHGNTLEIKLRSGEYSYRNTGRIIVTLSAPVLEAVSLTGASEFNTTNTIKASHFEIDVTGASVVKAALDVQDLKLESTGASTLKLSGKADKCKFSFTGASMVRAYDLAAHEVYVKASGASVAEIFADKELEVSATGASVVRYKGDASMRNMSATGASTCRKIQ